jgi:hypothetical protein
MDSNLLVARPVVVRGSECYRDCPFVPERTGLEFRNWLVLRELHLRETA